MIIPIEMHLPMQLGEFEQQVRKGRIKNKNKPEVTDVVKKGEHLPSPFPLGITLGLHQHSAVQITPLSGCSSKNASPLPLTALGAVWQVLGAHPQPLPYTKAAFGNSRSQAPANKILLLYPPMSQSIPMSVWLLGQLI